MKRDKLHFPYKWEERKPQISEGVFFIPDHYYSHEKWTFPSWATIFGNNSPVHIEYGSGNGMWVLEKALASSVNWVAVEYRFDRVQKIWSKMKHLNIKNLFIICGEAQTFTKKYLPNSSIDQIFVNFPDPWPKSRHAKHRLFQSCFIRELLRILKPMGTLTAVTDDATYGEQIHSKMLSASSWESTFPAPHFITEWEGGYGSSYFDTLWRQKGKLIRYFQFKKT